MMDSRFIPSDTYRLQQSHRGIPTSIVPPPPPPPHLASTTATTAAIRFIPTPNESHLLPLPPTPSLPLLRLGHTFPVLAPNTTRMSIPPPPPPLPLHHENHSQRNLDLMASTSIYTSMRLPQAQSSALPPPIGSSLPLPLPLPLSRHHRFIHPVIASTDSSDEGDISSSSVDPTLPPFQRRSSASASASVISAAPLDMDAFATISRSISPASDDSIIVVSDVFDFQPEPLMRLGDRNYTATTPATESVDARLGDLSPVFAFLSSDNERRRLRQLKRARINTSDESATSSSSSLEESSSDVEIVPKSISVIPLPPATTTILRPSALPFTFPNYRNSDLPLPVPLARATYVRKPKQDPLQSPVHMSQVKLERFDVPALNSVDLILPLPGKSAYQRPAGVSSSASKSKRQKSILFPLSSLAKSRSLPRRLESIFPDEAESFSSARLYSPSVLNPANLSRATGPIEAVLYGFWPAPPRLDTGQGLYPAPLALPDVSVVVKDERRRVEVFVDNSNIVYSLLNWLRTRPEVTLQYGSASSSTTSKTSMQTKDQGKSKKGTAVMIGGKKARLDYTTLFAILERGRRVERRVLVGSSPLWQGLEGAIEWGYEVSILQRVPRMLNSTTGLPWNHHLLAHDSANDSTTDAERGPKRSSAAESIGLNSQVKLHKYKEQAVDELIHMKILESLLDFTPPPSAERPILVLATGDANASEYSATGFLGCVRRALERGWDIEIIAFFSGTSSNWIEEEKRAEMAANEVGDGAGQRGRLRVIDLQEFAAELVL